MGGEAAKLVVCLACYGRLEEPAMALVDVHCVGNAIAPRISVHNSIVKGVSISLERVQSQNPTWEVVGGVRCQGSHLVP